MSSFFSSSSQSYYSSTSRDGKTDTHAFSEQTRTNPQGTTIRTAYKDNDKPVQYTEDRIPARNAQLEGSAGKDTSRRIEDVSQQEADKRYEEAMEDEYAKREGGA
ncbi:unnamed protein product [Clonostachys rosea]|uniref:Hypervirulence associated protein TUDOR domain-containing protein n=1 Tax=Bionectria ochroleuca TaxID=29856 RepID=A0ABY6TZJ4_BIOOC|nr:unnamed protein product [Clonostachys rosea]